MPQTSIVKPLNTVQNGGGNGHVPPPPPTPPGLTVQITSPTNNDPVVGNNPGVNLSVTCSVTVSGLVANQLWARSMNVYVQLGSAAYAQATLTAGSGLTNGMSTWVYTHATPTGGSLQINAYVALGYSYPGGANSELKYAAAITVEPSVVELTVNVPTDGQVFVGTGTGFPIAASGSASSTVPITNVTWVFLDASGNPKGTPTPMKPGPGGWNSWSGLINTPLGLSTIQITATDNNKASQSVNAGVQVALNADVLGISAQSYLQALVDFGTKPFTADNHSRVLAGNLGDLTPAIIDTTFCRSTAVILSGDYSEQANEEVNPARICIEILRRYIVQNPPTPSQMPALAAAQLSYQTAAYTSLLQQIGTSYSEIRLARTYNRQDPNGLANAQALAARLGIDLSATTDPYGAYTGDHLDRLCFAPQGTPDTTLVFKLTVTDSTGTTGSATVNIVVYGNNSPITLKAGNNRAVNKGATVDLSASGVDSTPGATIASYQWTQTAGPSVTLNNPATATPNFVAPAVTADTLYTFQVVATDSHGATASSTVNVTVSAATRSLLVSAGNSQTAYQEAGVNLSGSATDTTAGATITYLWTQISGPPVTLVNANTANAGFAAPLVVHPIQFLNEQTVEHTFGLVDSTRDPFSQGSTVGDTQGIITRWNIEGVQWNRADPDGIVYLEVESVVGQPSQLTLYKEKGRVNLLATGTGNTPGEVALTAYDGSGVYGNVLVNANPGSALIGLSIFPRLLSWQRQHIRSVWQQQDFQFTQSAVIGDTQSQIVSCNISGVQPGTNTDANGNLYISLEQVAGPAYQVTLFEDAARAKSVASGTSSKASGQITLTAANNSGLSGAVTIDFKADSAQIMLQFVYIKAPLIDPDVLIPEDFKYRVASDPAYSLYTSRQATIQNWISQLKTQAAGTPAGLNSILQTVLKDPTYYPNGMQISDIFALNTQAQNGVDISPQLTALQLSLDGFNYLVQICPVVQSGFPILDSEWSDIFSILVQVQKLRAYTSWCIQEFNAQLTLGPDFFNYPPSPPPLANTGMDPGGLRLPNGNTDLRWTIISTPSGATPAPCYVTNNSYPLGIAWIANDSYSQWISPQANESVGDAPGLYTYRTTLDLTGYDPGSVTLTVLVAVDNAISAVRLNGISLGLTASGYNGFTTLEIDGPFQSGVNTLDFVAYNAGTSANPSGFRALFSYAGAPGFADHPAWRATIQQRQIWQDSLNARIVQDDSLATGLQSVGDQTERQALDQLRNALVEACAFTTSIPTLYSTGTH
jgi:hypothetical protein